MQSTFAYGFSGPEGLDLDSLDNLFEADYSGNIYEFTSGGVLESTIAPLSGIAIGLTFDSAGNLFVSTWLNDPYSPPDDSIYKITPGGVESTFASGLDYPEYMAFQPMPELAAVVTNGVFQVAVSMPSPYHSTIIQASTNLVNWVNIYTNTPPFTFTNSMTETLPQYFYRAVLGH
jgi:hypothetical protein